MLLVLRLLCHRFAVLHLSARALGSLMAVKGVYAARICGLVEWLATNSPLYLVMCTEQDHKGVL